MNERPQVFIDREIKCVVFDFAWTLCSDGYFKLLQREYYDAVAHLIFGEGSSKWADPWCAGEICSRDIADYLSTVWPISSDYILQKLREGCAKLDFNPAVWNFAMKQREAGRKIALVTVNMDVFSEIVVPAHGLDQVFDVIINSSDFKEPRKEVLCRKAFDVLGSDEYGFHNSFLIDDTQKQIDMFRKLGGLAYRYTDDAVFSEWLRKNDKL